MLNVRGVTSFPRSNRITAGVWGCKFICNNRQSSLNKSLAHQYPYPLYLSVVVSILTINHGHVNPQSCALGAIRGFVSKCLKNFQFKCFTINSFTGFIASLKDFLDEPPICSDSSTNLCTQDCRSRKAGTSSIEERLNRRSIAHQGHDPGPGRRAINS
jgi:hypothetical protein